MGRRSLSPCATCLILVSPPAPDLRRRSLRHRGQGPRLFTGSRTAPTLAYSGTASRERLGNPLAGQSTGAPPEATATEAFGEGPVTGLVSQVNG